ncbi:MAG: hypothetical protein DI573_03330 [Microbacterium sp.]|uniref:cell division protein PerM n=1 Tax=Microbacterium sp. TaxID=51671 RepID=UPI000DB838AE|nr:DUF6350 family protein [Microbacterium sp.]PZU40668.1 MAG: hypothetical protein DI573_03330 [Microbacterium sp.]
MYRVLVALLCALDAAIAAAVGLAMVAAPLTLLWVFGMGSAADWAALWPATGAIWQLGHLVPMQITLPAELIAAGIPVDAASFPLSVAPLALAVFSAVFGLRSGARAARAGAWLTGAASALAVSAAASTLVALTSANPVAAPVLWQAILYPAAVYTIAVLAGGIACAWNEGDDGIVDAVRDALAAHGRPWAHVVEATVRASIIAAAVLVGAGAIAFAVAVFAGAGEIIALFQAGNIDGVGATIITLGQLAYLPTLVIWAVAWIAGPGFAFGAGTAVSPVGTEIGPVPGIPVLGALPEVQSMWLLLVVLIPVAAGALAGWVARSDLVAAADAAASPASASTDRMLPRLVTALATALVVAGIVAGLAAAASGSLGPGALVDVGPHAGMVALAVGAEVLVGAAILLLAPLRSGGALAAATHGAGAWAPGRHSHDDTLRRAERWGRAHDEPDRWHHLDETAPIERVAAPAAPGAGPTTAAAPASVEGEPGGDTDETAPIERLPPHPGSAHPAD